MVKKSPLNLNLSKHVIHNYYTNRNCTRFYKVESAFHIFDIMPKRKITMFWLWIYLDRRWKISSIFVHDDLPWKLSSCLLIKYAFPLNESPIEISIFRWLVELNLFITKISFIESKIHFSDRDLQCFFRLFSIKPDNFLMGIGRHCNKVWSIESTNNWQAHNFLCS